MCPLDGTHAQCKRRLRGTPAKDKCPLHGTLALAQVKCPLDGTHTQGKCQIRGTAAKDKCPLHAAQEKWLLIEFSSHLAASIRIKLASRQLRRHPASLTFAVCLRSQLSCHRTRISRCLSQDMDDA